MAIHKILVPLDGSESAGHALGCAVYFAQACRAELGLLTLIDLNQHFGV